MNRLIVFIFLLLPASVFAQTSPIHSGSTIYIEPMDGYETYLTAAIVKKQVPLVVVADKSKADYTITSSVSQRAPTSPAVVINNTNGVNSPNSGFPAPRSFGRTNASISVIDAKTSQIVFAYAVGKAANTNQLQSTAEACAKHLKEFIEKSEKPKK
jgi:hypothetical protein